MLSSFVLLYSGFLPSFVLLIIYGKKFVPVSDS